MQVLFFSLRKRSLANFKVIQTEWQQLNRGVCWTQHRQVSASQLYFSVVLAAEKTPKQNKKSFHVYETMADIQYQAYFGKLFKDNQNTKKKSPHARLHSTLSELPTK